MKAAGTADPKSNVFRRIFVRCNETNLGESHGVEKSKQQQQQQQVQTWGKTISASH